MSVAAPNPLAALSDHVPILLMPVRIETRFRPAGSGLPGSPGPQLWIRIYPDACSIDSFEPQLTASEISVTAAFWIATWRAGGVDVDARGAWRALVGSAGAGRAAYLIAQYAPANPTDRPTKARPQDIVLVIAPQPSLALTDAERAAAIAYWTAVWRADGGAPRVQTALTELSMAVGGDARALQIIAGFAPDPAGWDPRAPDTRASVGVQIATIALPPAPAAAPASWTRAPVAAALPDHFVALGFTGTTQTLAATGATIPAGLATGPDPSSAIAETDSDLQLDANVAWLGDFPRAIAVGMAIAVDLTAEVAANGVDRLIVLGVRTSATATQGQQLIEQLIAHQAATKAGYGIVPQGTPTTNTDAGTTSYSWIDDPDASYDLVFGGASAYMNSADPLAKRDGEWLAEALGIDGALVRTLANAAGTDQLEARAMNTALWNATGGYMLDSMLAPLVSAADSAATRAFFVQNVSGRGPLPSLRVGDQPYGVLPAISLARYSASDGYAMRLRAVIASMTAEWTGLAAGASHVGAGGDPLQTLLDILGLQPGSVEFYQRYADGLDLLYNKYVLEAGVAAGTALVDGVAARRTSVLQLLQTNTSARPPIFDTMLFGTSSRLTGPIVDDATLSDTAPIRPYAADGDNYLAWLAGASLDQIRTQDFGGRPEPTALLYLLARHAMMLCQWEAGMRLLAGHGLADLAVARAEPPFIHVHHTTGTASESRFAAVYAPAPTVTGSATRPLAEYVRSPTVLQTAPETEDLRSVVAA